MIHLLILLCIGAFVGWVAKKIHPGPDPVGCLPTAVIGIVGVYVGGFLLFLFGKAPLGSPSGILMGIIGAVIALSAWRWWNLQNAPSGARTFFSGRLK